MVRASALLAIALFFSALTVARRELFAFLVPLFLFIAVNGLIFPNSSATALAYQGHRAGAASSLLGTLQWSIACASSFLVSFLHNGTALPMAGVMLGTGLLGALFIQIVSKRTTPVAIAPSDAQVSIEAEI